MELGVSGFVSTRRSELTLLELNIPRILDLWNTAVPPFPDNLPEDHRSQCELDRVPPSSAEQLFPDTVEQTVQTS